MNRNWESDLTRFGRSVTVLREEVGEVGNSGNSADGSLELSMDVFRPKYIDIAANQMPYKLKKEKKKSNSILHPCEIKKAQTPAQTTLPIFLDLATNTMVSAVQAS